MTLPTVDRIEDGLHTSSVFVTDLPPKEAPCATQSHTSGHRLPMRCEVVTDFLRLEELSAEWARLWKCDPQAEIFQSPEWAIAWWRSFGTLYNLCSLVVSAGDEVVGIVPLVKRDGLSSFSALQKRTMLTSFALTNGLRRCSQRRSRRCLSLSRGGMSVPYGTFRRILAWYAITRTCPVGSWVACIAYRRSATKPSFFGKQRDYF